MDCEIITIHACLNSDGEAAEGTGRGSMQTNSEKQVYLTRRLRERTG